mmetsp:Transcript_12811/g.33911  ORF Transcript_12811/g.33911 Transcript_12811/m.33911 type:complete len:275 (+) Transcript_12811:154-978(+)
MQPHERAFLFQTLGSIPGASWPSRKRPPSDDLCPPRPSPSSCSNPAQPPAAHQPAPAIPHPAGTPAFRYTTAPPTATAKRQELQHLAGTAGPATVSQPRSHYHQIGDRAPLATPQPQAPRSAPPSSIHAPHLYHPPLSSAGAPPSSPPPPPPPPDPRACARAAGGSAASRSMRITFSLTNSTAPAPAANSALCSLSRATFPLANPTVSSTKSHPTTQPPLPTITAAIAVNNPQPLPTSNTRSPSRTSRPCRASVYTLGAETLKPSAGRRSGALA